MDYVKNGNHELAPWQVDYLLHSISYPLDDKKRMALKLFNSWKEQLKHSVSKSVDS